MPRGEGLAKKRRKKRVAGPGRTTAAASTARKAGARRRVAQNDVTDHGEAGSYLSFDAGLNIDTVHFFFAPSATQSEFPRWS